MTKFNQYSIEDIKKYIALGAEKKDMDRQSFLFWVADYSLNAIPFIEIGYQNPDFIPEIKEYYRIGCPINDGNNYYKNSFNFAEDRYEDGISVVTLKCLHSFKSVFFGGSDEDIKAKGVYKIKGFALPAKGGDSETLIIPMDWAVKTIIRTRNGLEKAVKNNSSPHSV